MNYGGTTRDARYLECITQYNQEGIHRIQWHVCRVCWQQYRFNTTIQYFDGIRIEI